MTTFPELREALPAFKGWGLECVEAAKGSDGVAYVGSRYDDGDLAIILVVDTGQYLQDAMAMPLARAVSAACTNAPAMLAHIDTQTAEIERLRADSALWQSLYRRAINEANGLTNYVEERPELRRAERNLTAIQADAHAALEQK